MSTYARANTTVQWFADDYRGSHLDPNCGVLHTTEGTTWPGYDGGSKAPNYTAMPDVAYKRLLWRAHFPDEMSSRALRNEAGGVNTNTANAVQVELVGTCSPATRDAWQRKGLRQNVHFIFWPEAPDWALADLAAFVADMHTRHGIKIEGPVFWRAYPASYGKGNPNRFTFTQWRAFLGWCGHQHVPENDHGDPGALDWAKVQSAARALVAPRRKPKQRDVVVSVNLKRTNRKVVAAIATILALLKAGGWGRRPDAIATQESMDMLDPLRRIPLHKVIVDETHGIAGLELAVLLRRFLVVLFTEYIDGAEGIEGATANRDDRGIWIVGWKRPLRRKRRVIINSHLPVLTPESREGHLAQCADIATAAKRYKARGFLVYVTVDFQGGPLAGMLEEIGMTVVRKGIDLVAFFPDQLADLGHQFVPAAVINSDHPAIAVRTQRK